MKSWIPGLVFLFCLVSMSTGLVAESATFSWRAGHPDELGIPFVCRPMVGPSVRNKDPGNTGPFLGEFVCSKTGPRVTLESVHLIRVNDQGELASKKIEFVRGETSAEPDETLAKRWSTAKESLIKTRFQTAEIAVHEGDAFLLQLKYGDHSVLVLMRINYLIVDPA